MLREKITDITHRYYEEQVNQGYIFVTNAIPENVTRLVNNYESQGLECFVGDVAFDFLGMRLEWCKTILVRKKRVD
jgi:hypothetical protein